MKKDNKNKKQNSNIKLKQNYDNISIYKSNLTLKKYINDRFKEINIEKKNEIKKNKSINYFLKNQNNLHYTNTSSTTISDKSTRNKDNSREINSINYMSLDINNEYNNREKEKDYELKKIKEENENLKIQLMKCKKKESNLEDILNNYFNENNNIRIRNYSKPIPYVGKYPISVKRRKSKRITKYIRNEYEEIYFAQFENYMKENKTEGNL